MRKLGPALFIIAIAAASILFFALPASAQRLINGRLRLGDAATPVRIGGALEVNGGIFPLDTTLGFTIDGGMTVAGSETVTGTVKASVVDAGILCVQANTCVTRILPFTQTALDFASTTTTCNDSAGTTVTGAQTGDACFVGAPSTGGSTNASYTCYVSAANTVKIRHCAAGTADDPASATFTGVVISAQ